MEVSVGREKGSGSQGERSSKWESADVDSTVGIRGPSALAIPGLSGPPQRVEVGFQAKCSENQYCLGNDFSIEDLGPGIRSIALDMCAFMV